METFFFLSYTINGMNAKKKKKGIRSIKKKENNNSNKKKNGEMVKIHRNEFHE